MKFRNFVFPAEPAQLQTTYRRRVTESAFPGGDKAALNAQREIAVTVTVKKANEVKKNVRVYVVPVPGCTQAAAEEAAVVAIRRYFDTLQIGDPFLLIQVGQYLLNSGMIANYDFALSAVDGSAVTGGVYVPGDLWAGELV